MRNPKQRCTSSYYRTLHAKYGVEDTFLQSRQQRRATGAFLEQLETGKTEPQQILKKQHHRRFKRVFKRTPFFSAIAGAVSTSAMLALLQTTPAIAGQYHTHDQQAVFDVHKKEYQTIINDEDSDLGQISSYAKVQQTQSTPNISLHLVNNKPPSSSWEPRETNTLIIDEDSDVTPNRNISSLTVIDTTIKDWQSLQQQIVKGEVLLLEGENPLDAILNKLEEIGPVDALNVISHGSSGSLHFSNHTISEKSLLKEKDKWSKLGQFISREGDILLFGCNVAHGEKGTQFIEILSDLTGADIAASVDVTGHRVLHGDWDLEAVTGYVVEHTVLRDENVWQGVLPTYKFSTTSTILNTGIYSLTGTLYNGTKAFKVKPTYRLKASSSGFFYFNKDTTAAYTFYLTPNGSTLGSFDISDMQMSNGCNSLGNGSFTTFNITGYLRSGGPVSTTASGVMNTGQSKSLVNDLGANFTGFNDVVKLKVTEAFSGGQICAYFQTMTLSDMQEPPPNDDGTVTAAGGVSEPVNLVTTATSGSPLNVFDFAINDGGGDATTVDVSQIEVNLGGTSSGNFSKMRFNLTGCATKTGIAPSGSTVTFPSTGIVVSNGSSVTCTVQAYWNDNTGITDNQTLTLSVDGDADLTVNAAKTTMSASNTPVTTGNMSTEVVATKLTIETQPAGSVSHQVLTTQPVLHAKDAADNLDLDYTTSVVASEDDFGSLVGTITLSPVAGIATYTDLIFNALADQSDFEIDFASSGLTGVSSTTISSDVVATMMVFTTEPAPTSIISGESTGFTTVPVVKTVNAGYVIDQGYSTDITLTEVLGPGSSTMTGTGDTDADGTTVSIAPSSGASTFTGLTLSYTNDASSLETFKLRASSGSLIPADSTTITSESLSFSTSTYDASTGVLVVSGVAFEAKSGAANDVTANKFTIRGDGGVTYTLTDTPDVEITSSTQFTLNLSATDKLAVNGLLNANGFLSDDITTYNVSAADDWMANVTAGNTADPNATISVSNVAAPTVSSATYDASTGDLVVTGTRFVEYAGANNDVAVNRIALTGEGGGTYTLTSSNVEVTSETSFTVSLNSSDRLNTNGLLNKNGTQSDDTMTYNLAAADNWMGAAATTVNIADLTGNGITVSNYSPPSISSASYNSSTGEVTVTGTDFVAQTGANNDVNLSALTFTGEGGGSYTLTTGTDVDVTNDTSFTFSLSGQDRTNVNHLLNADGTQANDGATNYNLAAADNWMNAAPATANIADATNGVTVSNVETVSITSASYNSGTGTLVVTGTNFVSALGGGNDVDVSTITIRGEAGDTYTLTSSDVELTSTTEFTISFNTTDRLQANQLWNKNGSLSDDISSIRISAADDWLPGAITIDNIAATNKVVTVSNYNPPTISSSAYNWNTGELVVTGTNFAMTTGSDNDVDISLFTVRGEGGDTHVLTTSDVDVTSLTGFTISLNSTDQLFVNGLLNADGFLSDDITTYRLSAADNWMPGGPGSVDISDASNNIQVSNVSLPTIASMAFNYELGSISITGTNFSAVAGIDNDVDLTTFTVTGEGGGSYTLTTSGMDVSSDTSALITLEWRDIVNMRALLNKEGTASNDSTTYNVSAADNWMAGAPPTSNIADLTNNSINVSNYRSPTISSATFSHDTGLLIIGGQYLVAVNGVNNDVDLSQISILGQSGAIVAIDQTTDVDLTTFATFNVTLSSSDMSDFRGVLNKEGTNAEDNTLYNVIANDNWLSGAVSSEDISDLSGNTVNTISIATPEISSATYDAATGVLVVTGNLYADRPGTENDIDVSQLRVTGEAGATYTLTSSDVDVAGGAPGATFTVTLNAADRVNVNGLLNKNGSLSDDVSTYILGGAEDWMPGYLTSMNIADLSNPITVSNVAIPTITSATYDGSSGTLVVTGTNFTRVSGGSNDVDMTRFTLTGEAGGTHVLTSTNVEISSATNFTVTLNTADIMAVNALLNKAGTASDGGTTYNLAAADNWMAGAATSTDITDATGNGITVNNVPVPTVTSATYEANTAELVVTGSNLTSVSGGSNDVDVTALTLTGEAGGSHVLTSSNVDITSAASFTVTLNDADTVAVNGLLNKNGLTSDSGTTYNLAAADNWMAGAAASADIADTTGNGITVSNVTSPTVTSATYDMSTGELVLTGTKFVGRIGAANDLIASLLTLTGEGGDYTLTDTANAEVSSPTSATLLLSATDQLHINGLLNKNGTASSSATTYNLAAADDWLSGTPVSMDIADVTGNSINVSNVCTPTITSGTYDVDIGELVVTGTCIFKRLGADNDVDISAFTFTGGTGNQTYTLTTATDIEISSATSFSFTLTGADKTNVDSLLDQLGTISSGGSTYNLAAADDWMAGADVATDIADVTNAITVVINPRISSATYNANTGVLVVTGTNISANGGGLDIDASMFTLTGEGGSTYTLTDTPDVNRDSLTQFTLTLSATDMTAVNPILNKDGTSSTSATIYNLAAADDWCTDDTSGDTSDPSDNAVTVSNVPAPTVSSATYDAASGQLIVTGTDFLKYDGADNDIGASMFTFTGEGTYTLTDTSDVEISSATECTVALSTTDREAVNQIMNKNGTSSTSGITYNLGAAEDWATGADAAVTVADATGNGITVSNVAVPTITSAIYNDSTRELLVTGTGFLQMAGPDNDIDVSLFTVTGEGGTYTLTSGSDVDITSATTFSITLSGTDRTEVEARLDKVGTISSGGTTYNLAGGEDWAVGADTVVNVADLTGNAITVSTVEMDVQGNGVTITHGDTTPAATDSTFFGGVDVESGSLNKTFTIHSTGSLSLNLTGNPRVSIGGSNRADFTVFTQPLASISPSGVSSFQVTFNPTGAGVRTATVNIVNNDGDENPYTFSIQGIANTSHSIDSLTDENDGSCQDGDCSLRDALQLAIPGDTIDLTNLSGILELNGSELVIDKDITLTGPSTDGLTLSGNNTSRVLNITSGTVNISNITISNGAVADHGAGILNSGTLNISQSTLSGNSSSDGNNGGGIYNTGTVTAINTTFSGNSAKNGGGIFSIGIFSLNNSTLSNNSGSGTGGGLNSSGTLHLHNTIIANSLSGGDCTNSGTLVTNNNNLVEDNSCSPALFGDPNLGPLADNGGSTWTHSPSSSASPVIDTGDNLTCESTDQRGMARPADGDKNGSTICDIGSVEYAKRGFPWAIWINSITHRQTTAADNGTE